MKTISPPGANPLSIFSTPGCGIFSYGRALAHSGSTSDAGCAWTLRQRTAAGPANATEQPGLYATKLRNISDKCRSTTADITPHSTENDERTGTERLRKISFQSGEDVATPTQTDRRDNYTCSRVSSVPEVMVANMCWIIASFIRGRERAIERSLCVCVHESELGAAINVWMWFDLGIS